ncbi:MAG TPA: hypothetical protein VKH19_03045 [Gemmatimonadaceae bacterium]|nr:hypothetical protein [Gemmatimonadaceae bacterium]
MVKRLPAIGFVGLHALGLVYTAFTLYAGWPWLWLVRMVGDHVAALVGLPATFGALLVPLALVPFVIVVVLGVRAGLRVVTRMRRGEPEPEPALRLRAALYAVLAAVLVDVFFLSSGDTPAGPFRVRVPILGSLTLVIAYGWYARWSLRPMPRLRRGVDLLAMNGALALVLLELVLRGMARVNPSPLLVTAASTDVVRRGATREPAGKMRFDFPLNSGGHYDTEFLPASRRTGPVVVDIGDSFSYGTVPHAFHFTTVAEQWGRAAGGGSAASGGSGGSGGNVEIYNMGYPAIGPADYLYLLQHEALPLQPERVVVNLFMGNDLTETPNARGPARWFDADSYLFAVVWNRARRMNRAQMARPPEVAQQGHLSRDALLTRYPWLADPLLEQPQFSRDVYLELESSAAAVIASQKGRPQVDRTIRALDDIEYAAGTTPLAFMIIPAAFQVDDSLWADVQRASRDSRDRDLAHREIVAWLQCRGIPMLDLLPVLRAVPPLADGRRHLYHRNDTHFNARGNDVAGRALGQFIASWRSQRAAAPAAAAATHSPACDTVLKRSTAIAVPPVSLPLRVDIGEADARRWMPSGWSNDEREDRGSFTWSNGGRSLLAIPLPKTRDIRMQFSAHPFSYPGSAQQRVTVVVDGTSVAELPLDPQLRSYELIIPVASLRAAVDTIELRYSSNVAPRDVMQSADRRPIAVAWYSIDFSPSEGTSHE